MDNRSMIKLFLYVIIIGIILTMFSSCQDEETVAPATKFSTQRVPSTPTRFTATAASTSEAILTWADTSLFASGFRIQRKQFNGVWELDTTIGNVRTFRDTNLICNTRYFYRIAAINAFGSSVFSVTKNTTTSKVEFSLLPSGTSYRLYAVHFMSENNGIVVGDTGIILSTDDGGLSWNTVNSGVISTLRGINFSDELTGIIVGSKGTILRTTNGGVSWTKLPKASTKDLVGVTFIRQNTWVIVGTGGLILRSTDNGLTWLTIPNNIVVSFFSVAFSDTNVGVMVGTSGNILRTTDGGLSWSKQKSPTLRNLLDVSFSDPATGIAVGSQGTIIQSLDSGATWVYLASGTIYSLNSIFYRDIDRSFLVGDNAVFLDADTSIGIWKPQKTSVTSKNIRSVYFISTGQGIAVGDNGTILLITACEAGVRGRPFHTITK